VELPTQVHLMKETVEQKPTTVTRQVIARE
jgi:hypothetical protein